MQPVIVIFATLLVVVFLLHRKVELGHSMLAGSLLLTALTVSAPEVFLRALAATLRLPNTWEILIALFFVMCLEYQLRTSGLLDDVMAAARTRLFSDKLLLAGMPAFLGFLPSLGGAMFSAPLVENASRRYVMTPEQKVAVNYWFRHIWEFANPIMPGLLLAAQITRTSLAELIGSLGIFVILAVAVGWLVCLTGLKERSEADLANQKVQEDEAGCEFVSRRQGRNSLLLTAGPILLNVFLVVVLHFAASVSMAIVVFLMIIILGQKSKDILTMLKHGLDRKLLWGIFSILLFQQVLQDTGVLKSVVILLESYRISPLVIAGVLAFSGGILTGTSGGFVALSMPIIVAIAPGDLAAVSVGFALGTAGQMLSPMHLCFLVSIRYFGADFIKSMRPVALMEALMFIFVIVRYGFF